MKLKPTKRERNLLSTVWALLTLCWVNNKQLK